MDKDLRVLFHEGEDVRDRSQPVDGQTLDKPVNYVLSERGREFLAFMALMARKSPSVFLEEMINNEMFRQIQNDDPERSMQLAAEQVAERGRIFLEEWHSRDP